MSKRVKKVDSFREVVSVLPYYVIIDLIKYYQLKIGPVASNPYVVFGKFKKDRFGKIFQIFNSIFLLSPEFNKRLYLSPFGVVSLVVAMYKTRLKWENGCNWKNLEDLCFYQNGSIDFLKSVEGTLNVYERKNFPSLQSFRLQMFKEEFNGGKILLFHPKRLRLSCWTRYSDINFEEYFRNEEVRSIESLMLQTICSLTGKGWKDMERLSELTIIDCPNFEDELFQTQHLKVLKKLSIVLCEKIEGRNWVGCKHLEKLSLFHGFLTLDFIFKSFKYLRELNATDIPSNFMNEDSLFPERLEKLTVIADVDSPYRKFSKTNVLTMKNVENLQLVHVKLNFDDICFKSVTKLNFNSVVSIDEEIISIDEKNFPKLKDLLLDVGMYSIGPSLGEKLNTLCVGSELGSEANDSLFQNIYYKNLEDLRILRCEYYSFENWKKFPHLKKLSIEKKILDNNVRPIEYKIFQTYRFPLLERFSITNFSHCTNNQEFDRLIRSLDKRNFANLTHLKIRDLRERKLGDILFSVYEFPNLVEISLLDDMNTGENWKFLPKLEELSTQSLQFSKEIFTLRQPKANTFIKVKE